MDIIEFEMLIKDLHFGDGGYDMGVVYKIIRSLASEILLVKPEDGHDPGKSGILCFLCFLPIR